MDKLAASESLKKIALGEVNLDEIIEVLRADELVITHYRSELENLHQQCEQLQQSWDAERTAGDELTRRLVNLHDEVGLAKSVFRQEIEGKRKLLGIIAQPLDLEALDLNGLLRERESVQKLMGRTFAPERSVRIPT